METIILPGYSSKNRAWAEEAKEKLGSSVVVNWAHWETDSADSQWLTDETKRVVGLVGDKQVNILAKSIGTAVAMEVIKQKPELVNKVILCGVPIRDFNPSDENYYEPLKLFPTDKVLCIQNENDNHGSYAEAVKFLHTLNPNLKIISKPRSDHEYPYSDDFMKFFSEKEVI